MAPVGPTLSGGDAAGLDVRSQRLRLQRRLVRLEGQFVPLLVTVLLPILLLPLTASHDGPGQWLIPLLFSLLILQSIRTLPVVKPSRSAAALVTAYRAIGLLALAGLWLPLLSHGWPNSFVRATVMVLSTGFTLTTSLRLVQLLARVPRVNAKVMAGAAAGYIYLGLTGGLMATAIQVLRPGSFNLGPNASNQVLLDRLTYFSFVTIGGLGYGDVVPTNAVGERLVILLSVASTLYVVLLVGLLMGRFIATEQLEFEVEALVDEVEDANSPIRSRLNARGPERGDTQP
jgi:hypothetical protein